MICVQAVSLPPVNRREILRYAGAQIETPDLSALLDEALAEALPVLSGKVCWKEFPVFRNGEILDLGFAETASDALKRNLRSCEQAVIFAATIGLGLDRLIARYTHLSPAKALLLQAIGAERIEALCDTFCEQLRQDAAKNGLFPAPRFSPGYGDLPLEMQKDIFRVLDCSRKIGLTLNDSLLMSPSKSVTAIAGLRSCTGPDPANRCSFCGKTDCTYRRTV